MIDAPGSPAPGRQARYSPARRRIGLLGGSFNPAHEGHRFISLEALRRLALDAVWWMVSPQNPLKDRSEMAPLAKRMEAAHAVADHPRIHITDIERNLGTVHTIDTVAALRRRFPAAAFVWLMGADNLMQIHQWKQWERLFQMVPIAVFPRPTYSLRALSSVAARRFADARVPGWNWRWLADSEPPAWAFLHGRAHAASATSIRERRRASEDSEPDRMAQPAREPKPYNR